MIIFENFSSHDTDITAQFIRKGLLYGMNLNHFSIYNLGELREPIFKGELSCSLNLFEDSIIMINRSGMYAIAKNTIEKISDHYVEGSGFINFEFYQKTLNKRKPIRISERNILNRNGDIVITLPYSTHIKYAESDIIILSEEGQNAPIRSVKNNFKTDIWSHSRYGDVKNGPTNYFRKDDRLYLSAISINNRGSVLCLDINTGERVWQTECNLGWLHNYPDNKYFAGLNEEMFTVIDSYSGDILQKKRFEGVGGSSYLSYLKGDKFYFINNSLSEPTLDSINIKTLEHSKEIELVTDVKRYENASLSSLFRRPVVEHGNVYIPTSEEEMYIFESVYS